MRRGNRFGDCFESLFELRIFWFRLSVAIGDLRRFCLNCFSGFPRKSRVFWSPYCAVNAGIMSLTNLSCGAMSSLYLSPLSQPLIPSSLTEMPIGSNS